MFTSTHAVIVALGVICTALAAVYALAWHFTRDSKHAWMLSLSSVAVVLFGVWYFRLFANTKPTLKSEHPQLVADLVQVFKGSKFAAIHCEKFGEICLITKNKLEVDAAKRANKIKTGEQLAELRNEIRHFHLDGNSLSGAYPNLRAVVDTFLDEHAGTNKGEITESMRQAWIEAYHHLGVAAMEASKQL